MRILPVKTLVVARSLSVIAEALCFGAMCTTARFASDGLLYRLLVAFHKPADVLRSFFLRNVENHPSVVDNFATASVFFGTAISQWL